MERFAEIERAAYIQPWNDEYKVEVVVFNNGEPESRLSSHKTLKEALTKLEEYFSE